MSLVLNSIIAPLAQEGYAIQQQEETLVISTEEGLDAYLNINGDQVIVETILFAESDVKNTEALNEDILRTHQLFPLSTVAVANIDEEDYYTAFGALSADSKVESVVIEVQALFDNVEGMIECYGQYLS
jgi:hypothetical protein